MNQNSNNTCLSRQILPLYIDALSAAIFTRIIAYYRVQTGEPGLSVSETLLLWLLLGGLNHLVGAIGVAVFSRYLLWRLGPVPASEPTMEMIPIPVMDADPDGEADAGDFWRDIDRNSNHAFFWDTWQEDDNA